MTKPDPKVSTRSDVCDDCWDARIKLINARKSGQISAEQFAYAQHGKSRRARIEEVLGVS